MNELLEFVARYGYLLIFFSVFLEQIGIPLPSNLLLIAAGVLIGLGQLDFAFVISLTVFAAVLGDLIWFYIGRRSGYKVLGFLCQISLEPDVCVGNAKGLFSRLGDKSLLIAKFIPAFSTFAQPVAGASKMSLPRFLFFDGIGSLIWVLAFITLGYIFSDQFEIVIEYATSFGWWFGAILVGALVSYLGWKVFKRQSFLKSLRTAQILPEELKSQIDAGEEVTIVDLREEGDFNLNPQLIPTAIRMTPQEIERRHEELPKDKEIVLYCT